MDSGLVPLQAADRDRTVEVYMNRAQRLKIAEAYQAVEETIARKDRQLAIFQTAVEAILRLEGNKEAKALISTAMTNSQAEVRRS